MEGSGLKIPASAFADGLGGERAIGDGPSIPGLGATPLLVHEPGGEVVGKVRHPSFSVVERLFRALPEESWFSPAVSPQRPIQFSLGTFEVPRGQTFWLYEYEFSVYRFSGVDAGDFIKAEEGRYSGVMGFDLTASARRPDNIRFELDPVPVQLSRPQFEPSIGSTQRATVAQFNRSAAKSFAAVASPGLALLPVRSQMHGPSNGPFTMYVREGETANLSVVIWRPVGSPLAAIEGRIAGYLMGTQLSQALLNRMRPR